MDPRRSEAQARAHAATARRPARAVSTLLMLPALALAGCADRSSARDLAGEWPSARDTTRDAAQDVFRERRRRMVEQLRDDGIRDARVLQAMLRVPRHRFVPPAETSRAYADSPLPIGSGQTISQPYVVAYMTAAADVAPGDTVLEIGTGSGYQAAVLAELAAAVYSVEIVPELAARARATLAALRYDDVRVRTGDGYRGWPEHAPYDAIVVTAAPDHVPPALVEQLAVGGRLVIPVGTAEQELLVITKDARGATRQRTIPVLFVPLVRPPGRDSGRPPPSDPPGRRPR